MQRLPMQMFTSSPTPPQQPKINFFRNISPGSNSLPTVIRSYKSAVIKHVHRLGFEFNWQPRYYDHIIRNENEYIKISQYITNNPKNWREDKFYPVNTNNR